MKFDWFDRIYSLIYALCSSCIVSVGINGIFKINGGDRAVLVEVGMFLFFLIVIVFKIKLEKIEEELKNKNKQDG